MDFLNIVKAAEAWDGFKDYEAVLCRCRSWYVVRIPIFPAASDYGK